MANSVQCRFCDGADPKRVKDGMIRCVRKHKFVDPYSSCPECGGGVELLSLEEIRESVIQENLRRLRCDKCSM